MSASPVKNPREPNPYTVKLKEWALLYASHHCYLRFERPDDAPDHSSDVETTVCFYEDGKHEFELLRPGATKNEWISVGKYADVTHLESALLPTPLSHSEREALTHLKVKKSIGISCPLPLGGGTQVCKVVRLKLPQVEIRAERGLLHNGKTSETKSYQAFAGSPHEYTGIEYVGIYAPTGGIWSLRSAETPLYYYLDLLPDHASLEFHVHLEAGPSGGPVVKAGIHMATLSLKARFRQGGRDREVNLLLDTALTPHDPSRFGWESPQRQRRV
jgi:hypothetical protein